MQLNVEGEFDFDREIEGLRSQVGQLKEVICLMREFFVVSRAFLL